MNPARNRHINGKSSVWNAYLTYSPHLLKLQEVQQLESVLYSPHLPKEVQRLEYVPHSPNFPAQLQEVQRLKSISHSITALFPLRVY